MSGLSIKNKVYAVVGVLIFLSTIIVCVAYHAMSGISESTKRIDFVSRVLNDMSAVRSSMQTVATNVREVVLAHGEEKRRELKATIEKEVALLDGEMARIGGITRLQTEWRDLANVWSSHKVVAARIIDLSLQDTNGRALALVTDECNPLRQKEAELFRTVLHDEKGIENVSTPMLSVPTDVREIVLSTDVAKIQEIKKGIEAAVAAIDAIMADMNAKVSNSAGWNDLRATWENHKVVVTNIIDLSIRNTNGEANALLTSDCNPLRQTEDRMFEAIMLSQEEYFDAITADADRNFQTAMLILLAVACVGMALGVVLSWLTVSRLSRTLMEVVDTLDESSSQVYSGAGTISGASGQLANGATEQAASLEETSSALEEMASMTRQNADNAEKTRVTTEHTVQMIVSGNSTVETVSKAMAEISESSGKISLIIKTIEDIAFQTNLLALNAAVEAARAGEAGKGFAVVADEVRNLAQRSAQAARDTTELIQGTVERVHHGAENVAKLVSDFKGIKESAEDVGRLVVAISTATSEQASGVDQVNIAVVQMDKVTQQNAASAEESASAAQELSNQAETLKGVVGDLVTVVNGGGGQRAAARILPPPGMTGSARKTLSSPRRGLVDGFVPERQRRLSAPVPASRQMMTPGNILFLDEPEDF